MIRIDGRESAHLRSRVEDLSQVPNLVSYTGLFAAVTPIQTPSVTKHGEAEYSYYEPVLIRDVDSLISIFGDPRIDPEKYIDLYSIMQIIKSGGTCYVAKVYSGDTNNYDVYVSEEYAHFYDSIEGGDFPAAVGYTLVHDTDTDSWIYRNGSVPVNIKNKYKILSATATITKYTAAVGTLVFTLKPGVAPLSKIECKLEGGKATLNLFNTVGSIVATFGSNDATLDLEQIQSDTDFNDYVSVSGTSYTVAGGGNYPFTMDSTSVVLTPDQFTYTFNPVSRTVYNLSLKINEGVLEDTPSTVVLGSTVLDEDWKETALLNTEDNLDLTQVGTSNVYNTVTIKHKLLIREIKNGNTVLSPSTYTAETIIDNSNTEKPYKIVVTFKVVPEGVFTPTITQVTLSDGPAIEADSTTSEELIITTSITRSKPFSSKIYYYNMAVKLNGASLCSAKVKLDEELLNKTFVNSLNSSLRPYLQLKLVDQDPESKSIARQMYDLYISMFEKDLSLTKIVLPDATVQDDAATDSFSVLFDSYINAINQYKDRRYAGRLMADLTAPITNNDGELIHLPAEERRALHYAIKEVASERKDTIAVLSTPYYDGTSIMSLDDVCNWVSSNGKYSDLWEYGTSNTTEPALQSFYLEIYYSWLNVKCDKFKDGVINIGSQTVLTAPANIVVNNILTSWRERGVQYPVAGDQYGVLPSYCSIVQNPRLQSDRDQLVQYRINPIYDTGTRGVQIYGNETLNAGYTDLNSAHIARTLVYLRSAIDEYTETLKFSINSQFLWDIWKNYVSHNILDPLKTLNGISEYEVLMGPETTSREEIANRRVNGVVRVIFYQSAEVFNLTYTVYSSSTTIAEATANSSLNKF
jgi:hypothetical protein